MPDARARRSATSEPICAASGEPARDRSAGASERPSRGSRRDPAVAVVELPTAMPHPTGPSGVQPKNWLTPGVCTTATSTPVLARQAAATAGLRPPTSRVCPSSAPTTAASPTVRARAGRPVALAASQADEAAAPVATARTATSSVSADPSDASGPSASSGPVASGGGARSAMVTAGARSVSRFTSSN